MVRLLKVKELERRKRFLLAKSEIYRQTLKLEIANVKFSTALLKRKLKARRAPFLLLGSALPLAGLFFARKKRPEPKPSAGLLGKLLFGIKLFGKFKPLWKNMGATPARPPARQNLTQFPGGI